MAATDNMLVWLAAKEGRVQELNVALNVFPSLIDVSIHNQTPLCVAAQYGHVEIIETLVQRGSQALDTLTPHGTAPLHYAAQENHIQVVELLVQLGSRMLNHASERDGFTPLHYAVLKGHVLVLEKLIQLNVNVAVMDNNNRTLLHMASTEGHAAITEHLTQLNQSSIDMMDRYGSTPIWHAADAGYADIIEVLMRYGCTTIDTLCRDATPLFAALSEGHIDAAETLIRLGCNTNVHTENNSNVFHAAAQCKSTPQLVKLLKTFDRSCIDAQTTQGKTPLYEAVYSNRSSMIFTLLSLGSKSINTPDTSGCTPLQSSLIFSGTKTTKLLIQHGASLDVLIDESITNIFEADFSVTNLKNLEVSWSRISYVTCNIWLRCTRHYQVYPFPGCGR